MGSWHLSEGEKKKKKEGRKEEYLN